MNEAVPPPRRVRTIFRVLSVLTFVAGGLGLLVTASEITLGPTEKRAVESVYGQPYPDVWLVYLVESISLIFNGMLVRVGTFLWKHQRRGLLLLIAVLVGEFFYCIVFSVLLDFVVAGDKAGTASQALGIAHGYILGAVLWGFIPQFVTAFPIVAGILIFFAYRYLGIPPRPIQ